MPRLSSEDTAVAKGTNTDQKTVVPKVESKQEKVKELTVISGLVTAKEQQKNPKRGDEGKPPVPKGKDHVRSKSTERKPSKLQTKAALPLLDIAAMSRDSF